MSGLLIADVLITVPGVTVISPKEQPWAYLTPGLGGVTRTHEWVRQYILHKTIADDPEKVLDGAGPSGGAQATAEWWQSSDGVHNPKRYSGAHLVTGEDGVVACLADLANFEAWHATVSNKWSVGHETREKVGGTCWRASLEATVATCLAACEAMGIWPQVPSREYDGHPMKRMLNGGPDMVGIFGHRDNTEDRGKWDPGEELFSMLRAGGVEAFDFDAYQDARVWKGRQMTLAALGHDVDVDGIPGPKTVAALRAAGCVWGRWTL